MYTTRLLTVSHHALWLGGVPAERGCTWQGAVPAQGVVPARGCTCPGQGGVPAQGSVPAQGAYLPRRCTCPEGGVGTPPCGQTDACENITFANFAGSP